MKTLLQISCDRNWGSIGHITEDVGLLAEKKGWDTFLIYGREGNPSKLKSYKAGNMFNVYEHYVENRLFDNDGLASRWTTRRVVDKIKEIGPDVIHLHNIHDHWLNYEILFEFLSKIETPIIWTQHDCWSYTGGCGYYSLRGCDRWKRLCVKCPLKKGLLRLMERTKVHFQKKRILFNKVSSLILVPVSHWLESELRQSFLKDNRIQTIYNGINTSVFRPMVNHIKERYNIRDQRLLVAAATSWSERKGLDDYIKLREELKESEVILLVGLTKKQIKTLPKGVIGLERTQDISELVELYSAADIVLNLSHEETFGLTTVEGFACGTPGIVYNSTASPELITPETGIVVEPGDIKGIVDAVNVILKNGKEHYSKACRERAVSVFNKDDRYMDYINLYEELLNERKSV